MKLQLLWSKHIEMGIRLSTGIKILRPNLQRSPAKSHQTEVLELQQPQRYNNYTPQRYNNYTQLSSWQFQEDKFCSIPWKSPSQWLPATHTRSHTQRDTRTQGPWWRHKKSYSGLWWTNFLIAMSCMLVKRWRAKWLRADLQSPTVMEDLPTVAWTLRHCDIILYIIIISSSYHHHISSYINTGRWFGTCFIFPHIGNNDPNWFPYFSKG